MRTQETHPLVRASLAVSLDGYIADKGDGVAWLNPFFSDEMDFARFMKGIGAAVMGRKTFDIAVSGVLGLMPPTSYPTFVPTHRAMPNPPARYEPFQGDPVELVHRLRAQLAKSGKNIWLMGGGETIEAFRAAGVVDRLELRIIPVLLGDGVPLFPRHARGDERWKLARHRAFKNGVVELWYERSGGDTSS
ncbi:MAG: dihydrofolate reductase family protein [Candidatus Acidiferrales bacterium]